MDDKLRSFDASAYHSAIVRIATARDREEDERPLLLFASVELVTSSRPEPDSSPINEKGVPQTFRGKRAAVDLAFRRAAMRAMDAVDWYRALPANPTLPIPGSDDDRGKYDGTSIRTALLTDEPAWPSLSTPLADPSLFGSDKDLYPTPFIGPGAYPAKIHRQFAALTPLLEKVLDDDAARTWLRRRIHFDVALYSELLGGAVLVVPDPDVASVRVFMAREEDDRERLVGEVLPRPGRSLKGLTLTLFEERLGALGLFQTFEVGGDLMIGPSTNQLDHIGYVLSHVDRGLVDQQKPLPFLRAINWQIGISSRKIQIETRDDRSKGADTTQHQVDEVEYTSQNVVKFEPGYSKERSADSRFYENAQRRREARLGDRQELQWFDCPEDARKFVRDLISRANEAVLIVDPYADGLDLFNFGHFVRRRDIGIRVLTSRLPFKTDEDMRAGFVEALRTFGERGVPVPDIRLLPGGQNPPIHDRFLVIDKNVWFSGNSLNAIGERASVMVKILNPADVRERLEHWFGVSFQIDLSQQGE
jgi:hypothetical protein